MASAPSLNRLAYSARTYARVAWYAGHHILARRLGGPTAFEHRDVKLENVLFDADDRPLLADFGIALSRHEDVRITTAGFAVGSAGYMAPEQARGDAVDARADLYSVGVLTWELLTGELPFRSTDPLALALMHAQKDMLREVERVLRQGPGGIAVDRSLVGLFLGVGKAAVCRTPMGKRLLRDWLCRPLAERAGIEARHAAVALFVADRRVAQELGTGLDGVQDVALAGRRRCRARRWDQFGESLDQGPSHLDPDAHPVSVAHLGEGLLDLTAQVEGDPIGSLVGTQSSDLGQFVQLGDPQLQTLGHQGLVEPGFQVRHVQTVWRRRRPAGEGR